MATTQSNTAGKTVYQNKLQSSRYEYKYIISETIAREAFRFVRCYLLPDQHTADGETHGYPVHSLYLDSSDLHTCRATEQGHKNRFKLRIRFYDDDDATPAFAEIKRRNDQVILKQRSYIKKQFVSEILAGAPPRPEFLFRDDPKSTKALYDFCRLRDSIDAKPAAYTSYLRAGYETSGDNSVRVTFDRQIRAGKYTGELSAMSVEYWPPITVSGVVLELKFTDRFPNWMHDLTQSFDLRRGSMPKYVRCVSLINHRPES